MPGRAAEDERLALPPGRGEDGAGDGARVASPEEGQRNFRLLVLKLGAVLLGANLLFLLAFGGMAFSAMSGIYTAQVAIKSSVAYYSWDELASISREVAASGSRSEALSVARRFHLVNADDEPFSYLRVALSDGTILEARLASIYDELPRGRSGLTFALVGDLQPMPMDETIAVSWDSTTLRSWLNVDLLAMLPPDLRRCAREAHRPSARDALRTTADRIWIASAHELEEDVAGDGLAAISLLDGSRLKGSWLRTPSEDGAGFCFVDEGGQVVSAGDACDPGERHSIVPLISL